MSTSNHLELFHEASTTTLISSLDSTFETQESFNHIYLFTTSGISFLIAKSTSLEKSFFSYSNPTFCQFMTANSRASHT